eukprot:TRINITY_DN5196_c0_g3_i1.p1 TRINITY_DN5196_c0_g3~~TRINITY_DN5196_c0_g3_i1.p1  ORF type:complete len:523 (+),score=117.74 TRINITY_DN5196_c0_g3_i1:87-1571(+)
MALAKSPIGILHYVEHTKYKAQKALIAAKFNGVTITESKFDVQRDSKKPCFLQKNPTGKVPFLETDQGCLFSSNSIAMYIARSRADTHMYGQSFQDESAIDTWLEFCTHELEVPLMTWVYPVMGLMQDTPEVTAAAKTDVAKALAAIEARLVKASFLVGNFVSLADICVVCTLREGFVRVFDPAFRKAFPKVCSWFEVCCAMPQFKTVLGDIQLCTVAAQPSALIFAPAPRESGSGGKAEAAAGSAKKEEGKKGGKKDTKKEPKKGDAKAPPAPPPAAATLDGGNVEAEVKAVGDELRALKEKLKSEGLSGKKMNEHAEVKALVEKLSGLKQQLPAGAPTAPSAKASPKKGPAKSPKLAPTPDPAGPSPKASPKRGPAKSPKLAPADPTGPSPKSSPKRGPATSPKFPPAESPKWSPKRGPAASPKQSPKWVPKIPQAPPVPEIDIAAQVSSVGDQIRVLKEKLKAEGLSGKKVNQHADVVALVSELNSLKAKM